MIEQWRRERAELDKEIHSIRTYIENSPNKDKYSSARAKLRALLNAICVTRLEVHQRILKYEDEENLHEIFKHLSGLSEDKVAKLMRDMERLKLVRPGWAEKATINLLG